MKQLLTLFLFCVSFQLMAQEILPLYKGDIPNSIPYGMKEVTMQNGAMIRKISKPTLQIYLPPKEIATGVAVIICPGGAYMMESYKGEGTNIAEAFVKQGIAAFVLKYRLPSDSIMLDKSIGPLQDAQQAIKTVRQQAATWNINPNKIGIMGFSAGGHLASTAGTHFEKSYIPNIENISLRPDFLVLIYPVISMADGLTHMGSRDNLLGKNPTKEQIALFSNDLQVKANTPITWLTQTGDDALVPVDNSIVFYQALVKNKVPSEMNLYPTGGHGFILKLNADEWMQPLFAWIKKWVIVP